MCRCMYLLVLIFSMCRRAQSSSSALIQMVKPGENITLHCIISRSTEMVWYHHINDELTVIVWSSTGNLDEELSIIYNREPGHFKALCLNTSLSLTIRDIRQSDIGLYYCGGKINGVMNLTSTFHLQFTDAVKFTSGTAQCWKPLVSVTFAFALMLMIFIIVFYQRGLSSSDCMKCVRDDDVKEADLTYASLRHNATPRTGDVSPVKHNVTYDNIAISVTKDPSVKFN